MSRRPPFSQLAPAVRRRRRALGAGAACALLASATPALAQRAGSEIRNIATAELEIEGTPTRIASNAATLRVAEVLDIRLAATGNGTAIDGAGSAVPFTLVNAGNGSERFVLAGTLEATGGSIRGFAIDANGNGVFDAGETLLDGTTPALAPGQSLALLAVLDPGMLGAGAAINLFARALNGSGDPGTRYPGRGDLGTDAIVGNTTGEANLRISLVPGSAPGASLEKSQSVLAPDGSTMLVRGTFITYTLVARFDGSGTARQIQVADPIPSGTRYIPGSLTLDDAVLSDAADGDAGTFDGSSIAVALGDAARAATRTIRFKVRIQ